MIEPAKNNKHFDENLLKPDAKLHEYPDDRAAVGKRLTELIDEADEPAIVAETVLKASIAANPKLRYTAGRRASRLQLLRTFAPAGMVDAGIRKNLRLGAA